MLVSIGKRKVPAIMGAGVTELLFSGGAHGKKEAGRYRFWTCVGEDQYGPFTIIGRARAGLSPGDRIARMCMERTKKNPPSHRRVYARMYALAQKHAHYVRPSTERELKRWADSHDVDWNFAPKGGIVRGKTYDIQKMLRRIP